MTLMVLLIGLAFGTGGYFAGVKVSKTSCEKNGYFLYVDNQGNKEKIKCYEEKK